ncbi:hypothetical protein ACS0TY_026218 [Phlomoides rotata]
MVYPPQNEEFGYDNGRNFDYDGQMHQVPFHYQAWEYNGNWSYASPMNEFQPQHDFQPNQDYDAPIYSSPIEELPIDEMFALVLDKMENLDARGVEEMREYLKKKMEDARGEDIFDKMKEYVEVMNQHLEDLNVKRGQLATSMRNLQEEEKDEEKSEEDPSEEEDEEVELNDEELEFIEVLDEFIEEFKEFDSMEHKDQETNENSLTSLSSLIYDNDVCYKKTNHIFPFIVLDDDMSPLKAKEEDKHCLIEDEEQEEDGPSDWKNEDDSLVIEVDQEERPLMDMSKNEQENQEASNDTLKSEMSISILLNSSIYYFLDNDDSIDFILPLDNFDHKKEVEKNLGTLEQKEKGWKDMLRSVVEEKLCIKGMDDRSTFHKRLIDEEAQRLRYNGKEDRYPWPFR